MRRRKKKKYLFLFALPFIFGLIYFGWQIVTPSEKLVATPIEGIKESEDIPEITLSISPAEVRQGDPALITIDGIESVSSVKSLAFNGQVLDVFLHDGKLSALVGIDLRLKAKTYPLILTLADGRTVQKDFVVTERTIVREQFDIPEKLGGNNVASEAELLETLNNESGIIAGIPSGDEVLWSGSFELPIAGPIEITDVYGYSRLTATAALSHKGTDYKADIGTPVLAINSGKVAFIGFLRNYGNVVAIDHGLGLVSLYLHLSQIDVSLGSEVAKGETLGLSGDTGYVLGPHLHLSVRIDGVSIDPEKFLTLLGH